MVKLFTTFTMFHVNIEKEGNTMGFRGNHKIIVVNTITGTSYEFNNIVSQVEIVDIQTYEMSTRKCIIITLIYGEEIIE